MMDMESVGDDDDHEQQQGAIMASLDPRGCNVSSSSKSILVQQQNISLPDVLSTELKSLNLHADDQDRLSFLVLDSSADDQLVVDSADQFALKLGCELAADAKVVSIVGNAGDGKSYALNKVFFGDFDADVFATSSAPAGSCTHGVWGAFEPRSSVVVLDTEGMLSDQNEAKRTRQLLKVLAISDLVICKTRAERIHSDLLYFLGDASKAFNEHFSTELQRVGSNNNNNNNSSSMMGPTVIIFHETHYTDINKSTETMIKDRLVSLSQDVSAFSKIKYFGVRKDDASNLEDSLTVERETFARLRDLVRAEVNDCSVRSHRSISLIYKTLEALNNKFSGDLLNATTGHRSFPDEYFTCLAKCCACDGRCSCQMNHEGPHRTQTSCIFNKSYDNKQYLCLRCYQNGRRVVVVPKASSAGDGAWLGLATYAWSGSVLECRICGVIYRSRQHWFGNESPEATHVVHTEISHIWPGVRTLQGTQNAARRVLDGVNSLSNTVSSTLSSSTVPASKSVSGWMADQIAPDYWRPNCDITNCRLCDVRLGAGGKIHHCRACGEGFCGDCSDYWRPVPERGWGPEENVRVCKPCYRPKPSVVNGDVVHNHQKAAESGETVQARKYGEKFVGTLNSLAAVVLDYPINVLKDSARPVYWVPDDECTQCCVCHRPFAPENLSRSNSDTNLMTTSGGVSMKLHHCRQCGCGVCDECSKTRKHVPLRGWDTPVRVCDTCKMQDVPTH